MSGDLFDKMCVTTLMKGSVRMKKFFAIVLVLCFASLSSAEVVTLSLAADRNIPEFYDHISQFQTHSFSLDVLDYQIVGGVFGSQDLKVTDFALNDGDIGLAASIGIGLGLNRSKFENKDALLALYLSVTPDETVSSPRAVPSIDFDIAITDDQGEDGVFVVNTLKDKFPIIGKPLYGVVMWGVYSDAKYFDIAIGGETIRLETAILPYLIEVNRR